MDLAHDKVNLFSRDHCAGKVVYWSPPGGTVAVIPLSVQRLGNNTVDMSVDGKPVSVAIVTANHSVIDMPAAYRIFGIDEHAPGLRPMEPDGQGRPQYRYPFHEIEVQGLKIENPNIVIEGKRSDPDCDVHKESLPRGEQSYFVCYGGADLFLGVSVLQRLHLFFAFGEKMLYATAAS